MSLTAEGFSIDEIIDKARSLCSELPRTSEHLAFEQRIHDLRERLAHGTLRLAVLGQFNRGKSTFINALLKLPVLPTSVLPITSVPTVLTYGSGLACTIAFQQRDPIDTGQSDPEAVHELLLRYVAEENNPRNHLGVTEVKVECRSPVLFHGTALIDTPGFGSTHIHNTKTTLNLLSACDAALFLLSADLPITQVEVDFLKEVRETVPRLFFIFNKTDLLKPAELEKTKSYIRGILIKELDFSSDIRLFPVCARDVEPREGERPDEAVWERSGMESVKVEIVDFMLREKYFALSEAINDKLKDALGGIDSLLAAERRKLREQIQQSESAAAAAAAYRDTIRKEIAKELRLLDIEKESMTGHMRKHADARREKLSELARSKLRTLVDATPFAESHLPVIAASVIELVDEMLQSAWLDTVSATNRPLRKTLQVHHRQLKTLAAGIARDLSLDDEAGGYGDALNAESQEFEIQQDWHPPRSRPADFDIRFSFSEKFGGPEKKRRHYLEKAEPLLESMLSAGMAALTKELDTRVEQVAQQLRERLETAYTALESLCEQQRSEAAALLASRRAACGPRIDEIDSLRGRFHEVADALV
jgi:GTP-binding protein EngB required for normal cell division